MSTTPAPPPTVTFTYYPGSVLNTKDGRRHTLTFPEFGQYLLNELATDTGVKASAGYVVPCGFSDGRRRDRSAEPTRLAYLDWDDAPLDEAALAGLTVFAHTSDSHAPDADGRGARWHVFLLLDREYSAEEVARAKCPWPGAHLRAASQPAYVPTRGDDIEWFEQYGAPLRLSDWLAAPAAPRPTPEAWAPPTRRLVPSQASTNALVTRWLSRPEGTNRLAGATGAALAEWGWSDEDVAEYLTAWLGAADPRLAKHINDAVRGAQKRRAGDRIVGFPTLAAEGVAFEAEAAGGADVEALWAGLASETASPADADADAAADDGFGPWEYGPQTAAWDPPPVRWVCEAWCLAPGAPGLLTGYGGSGKTTLAQHLALAVVSGRPALDAWPVRQGAVTHLDYEQGADLTRRRYLQLGLSDLPAEAQARLRFRSFPARRLDAADPETARALLLAARGQTLLIVDSLVASGGTGEEENATGARDALDLLGRVSDVTRCAVLVVHHSKKDRSNGRTSARGSSAITDAVSVHLTYEKDDEAGAASPATLSLQKVRHLLPAGALAEPAVVSQSGAGRLFLVDQAEQDAQVEARVASVETELVALLATGWAGSVSEARSVLKRKGEDVSAAVKRLKAAGAVATNKDGLYLVITPKD